VDAKRARFLMTVLGSLLGLIHLILPSSLL
jgi:hypothetical protein